MNAESVSPNPLLEDALTALPEIAQRLAAPLNLTPYPDWQPGWDIANGQRVDASVEACRALVTEWVSQAAARMAVRKPWRLPVVAAPVAEPLPPQDLHEGEIAARLEAEMAGYEAEVAERAGAAMAVYAAEVGAEPVADAAGFPDETYDLETTPVTQDETDAEYQAAMDAEFNAPEENAGLTLTETGHDDSLDLDPVQTAAMERFEAAHDEQDAADLPSQTAVMPAVEAHTEAIPAVTEEGQP